ncbi:hypothetical protein [Costertonia aggregata]|uniref:DUF1330 domain-containing protein n=1 Tax=Costertonia aggregata TaxID=343403 RepID=A0A7H9APM7_9FLAO|nr:hypothetical protein [Costertonia aggregata]QLG45418.1 hypothetical protein HYG79_08680 [Costertonia aggregata]
MKQTKLMLVFAALFLSGLMVNAQEETKRLEFKKGEVLDILLFTGKPEMAKLFPKYRKTAFVFASKTGYQPQQPILSVQETTQGGYQPGTYVFGKWPNVDARKKFLNEIVANVPDFHEQRRSMWSTFYVSYFEMEKDISFELNPKKVLVSTHLWKQNDSEFNSYQKEWLKKAKANGGKVILELKNSRSAIGYMYKPDYVVLTEWNTRDDFDAFLKEDMKIDKKGIQNVNQFVIK